MITETIFYILKGLYAIASGIDVLLQNSRISILNSVSGFVGLLVIVVCANIAIGGCLYYAVRSRK